MCKGIWLLHLSKRSIFIVSLLLSLVFVFGCGAQKPSDVAKKFISSVGKKDVKTFKSLFATKVDGQEVKDSDLEQLFKEFTGEYKVKMTVGKEEIKKDTASVELPTTVSYQGQSSSGTIILKMSKDKNGDWKINGMGDKQQ